ncbi:MAG: hypothetical protein KBT27_09330 [Prevotellaceae bacterium]|nr:hypothetical protein [Candidatus Faecinaster equi]
MTIFEDELLNAINRVAKAIEDLTEEIRKEPTKDETKSFVASERMDYHSLSDNFVDKGDSNVHRT